MVLRLTYERIRRHWSQTELGRRARIRQQDISLIEIGRLIPTEEQLLRLANALAITPPSVLMKPTVLVDESEAEQRVAQLEQTARDLNAGAVSV